MYFDTHAHYDNSRFKPNRDALLKSLPDKGISLVLNPGCNMASSKKVVAMAESYPFLYAAVGVHPHDSKTMQTGDLEILEALAQNPRVVALGEMGLDYHYDHSPRDVQRQRFRQQMDLARKVKLPAIVHQREAAADTLETLSDYRDVSGVVHCFSGSLETAKRILDLGWYLSFTGVITYKNAVRSHEIIRYMPKERLMIETDAPYMSPEPYRGRCNSSLYLPYIAQTVGDLLGISSEEAALLTLENGKRCFHLP